jgi:hypothetical protein
MLLAIVLRDDDITLFRGGRTVTSARNSIRTLPKRQKEAGARFPPDSQPRLEVAICLALVHVRLRLTDRPRVGESCDAAGVKLTSLDTIGNTS